MTFPLLSPLARAVSLVALLMVLGLGLTACGSEVDPTADGPPAEATSTTERSVPVEVVLVEGTAFEDVIQMTGTVEAPEDAVLSAETAGTLRTLLPLGRAVSRGQVVAQVDAGIAQASVQQAEAALQAARAQLELSEDQFRRQEPLYRDSIISALEFQSVRTNRASAQAQVAQAQAQVAQARENLSRTQITAPFSGTVEEHLAQRGEQVNPGTPVVRLVAGGGVKVTAGVPERYAADIRVGTPVVVTPQAYGAPPRRGTVSFVGRTVDPQSRTFPIEVQLTNADGTILKPQMVVRMEVTREVVEGALVVPLSAVVRDEQGTTVYVVEEVDGRQVARLRRVLLGPSSGGNVIVTDGLQPGELVITQGQNTVADGQPVRITDRRAPGGLSAVSLEQ